MFAAHDITVDLPHEDVLTRLTHAIELGSLHSISDVTYQGGLDLLVRVGPFGDLPGLSKLVRVRTLEPVRHGPVTTVSLRWEATGVAGDLFPALDADLVLMPEGDRRCHLRLVGSYRPPLGLAGAMLDKAIMGDVATATIRSLLERVAAALSTPLSDLHPSRPSTVTFDAIPQSGAA